MTEKLNIYCAGVALEAASLAADKWNIEPKNVPVQVTKGGSVDGIRRFLAGEPYDILILADDLIIELMLRPKLVLGYEVFAGNKMVLAANPDKPNLSINSQDWVEKVLAPQTRLYHFDPHGDPGGYRAVLSMMLADQYQPGLTDKLLNHPGRIVQKFNPKSEAKPDFDYFFVYYSMAKSRGLKFAELPPLMDLSMDKYASIYAKAKFKIDEKNTVTGTPIAHALAIPAATKNLVLAQKFSRLFLASDFLAFNFIHRRKIVGPGLGD
jgi:molybdate/tungstate transport system substrate-binding protein